MAVEIFIKGKKTEDLIINNHADEIFGVVLESLVKMYSELLEIGAKRTNFNLYETAFNRIEDYYTILHRYRNCEDCDIVVSIEFVSDTKMVAFIVSESKNGNVIETDYAFIDLTQYNDEVWKTSLVVEFAKEED